MTRRGGDGDKNQPSVCFATPLVNTTTFPDMGKMVECVFQSMMSLFILPLRLTVQACFSETDFYSLETAFDCLGTDLIAIV